MLVYFIKHFFIFLCGTYISLKILQYNISNHFYRVLIVVFSTICAFIDYVLNTYVYGATYILPFLMIFIFVSFYTFQPQKAFISTTVAFGINYSIFMLSSFIGAILTTPIHNEKLSFIYFIIALITGFLQSLITLLLFHTKRFRKGMPFLFTKGILNIATIICTLLITLLMYLNSTYSNDSIYRYAPFICSLGVLLLIHWWQAQITKAYKQALINRELESLRMELTEKEKQLAELAARNEELGRLIHKDNKRIPAMEHAVSEFLVMDLSDKEKAVERANTLLVEIQKLSEDRTNTVTEIYARKYKHHDTGISELDTMLNYMEKRAYGEHIKLSVQSAINFHNFVPNNISAEDLSHVLSDLLENAIIASKQITSPAIQLQFYQTGKNFVVEIADNGISFEATSLVNFGLEQLTTHADTGGSGIGLMDIWKIKEKYRASLHISEYNSDAPYTKKIALIFNKKNRYTISTERKEELLAFSKRTDLQVF